MVSSRNVYESTIRKEVQRTTIKRETDHQNYIRCANKMPILGLDKEVKTCLSCLDTVQYHPDQVILLYWKSWKTTKYEEEEKVEIYNQNPSIEKNR